MSKLNKELSRRFTDLFSTGDLAGAEEILNSDVVVHGTSADGEVRGLDQMLEFVAAYRRAFPDARSSVEDQIAEGDKVVTRRPGRRRRREAAPRPRQPLRGFRGRFGRERTGA